MNYSTEKDDYLMTTPHTKKFSNNLKRLNSFYCKMDLILHQRA
ncbi:MULTISPECIES: hypothetical protein [Prochlorococcus]|uniref:Uncharacterized protein n=1 Tax=Prochlorococcus marinus str. MIT 9116 TaxID=167544 RepID=A0A0A1ZQC1_PROMR|nr:hypothetical protein [Prochlorococcus marinus]KGF90692.1 hypothetical protein EU92_1065 [Prochlorococcus marinus str. MIT 9107]KGF90721.1 hypothetical protein EU93_1319 [Prochlorococcus marinus str. MIT 9116]KGF93717.1 hypothetical protein EU94_1353 [Prochlorococcus marinus str. MIT 9123]